MTPRSLKRPHCGTLSPTNRGQTQNKGKKTSNTRDTKRAPAPQVMVTDLISDMYATVNKLEKEVTEIKEKYSQLYPILNAFEALNCLGDEPATIKPDNAILLGKLVSHVTTEICERIRRSKNAIVFNVADKPKLSTIGKAILNASGLNSVTCTFRRLKKLKIKHTCPVLFEFADELTAARFIKSQWLVNQHPQFVHLRMAHDFTPLQRQCKLHMKNDTPRPKILRGTTSPSGVRKGFDLIELSSDPSRDPTPTISPQRAVKTSDKNRSIETPAFSSVTRQPSAAQEQVGIEAENELIIIDALPQDAPGDNALTEPAPSQEPPILHGIPLVSSVEFASKRAPTTHSSPSSGLSPSQAERHYPNLMITEPGVTVADCQTTPNRFEYANHAQRTTSTVPQGSTTGLTLSSERSRQCRMLPTSADAATCQVVHSRKSTLNKKPLAPLSNRRLSKHRTMTSECSGIGAGSSNVKSLSSASLPLHRGLKRNSQAILGPPPTLNVYTPQTFTERSTASHPIPRPSRSCAPFFPEAQLTTHSPPLSPYRRSIWHSHPEHIPQVPPLFPVQPLKNTMSPSIVSMPSLTSTPMLGAAQALTEVAANLIQQLLLTAQLVTARY